MENLFSNLIPNTFSFLKRIRIKSLLAAVLMGVLFLTVNINPAQADTSLGGRLQQKLNESEQSSGRPSTTAEWKQEARETEGNPGERLKKIGQETGAAFKQFGQRYAKDAKAGADDLGDKAEQAGKDLTK